MTEQLTILAKLRVKPGMESRMLQLYAPLRAATHKEDGCIYYDLHQSLDDSRDFIFYENWTTAAHLDAHMKTPHFATAIKVMNEISDGPIELTRWRMLT